MCEWRSSLITSSLGAVLAFLLSFGAQGGAQAAGLPDPGLVAVVQTGHGASISSVAVSHDGSLFASGGVDRAVKLWEVRTGRELRTFHGHGGSVIGLGFLQGDERIVTIAALDPIMRVFEVSSGRELARYTLPSDPLAMALRADGKQVAVALRRGKLQIWSIEEGTTLRETPLHEIEIDDSAAGLGFLADGSVLIAHVNGTLRVWHPGKGQLAEIARTAPKVRGFALSPDTKTAAVVTRKGEVQLVGVAGGKMLGSWRHNGKANAVAILRGGRVLSADYNTKSKESAGKGTLRLWEAGRSEPIWTRAIASSIRALALHPSEPIALAGGRSMTLAELDLRSGLLRRMLQHDATRALLVAFSRDGSRALSVSNSALLQLWDLRKGSILRSFPTSALGDLKALRGVALSPNGKWAAVIDDAGRFQVWHADSGKTRIDRENAHAGGGTFVAFSPKGDRIATGGADGCIRIWTMKARGRRISLVGEPHLRCDLASPPLLGVFSPDGSQLAVGTAGATEMQQLAGRSDPTLHVIDIAGKGRSAFPHNTAISGLSFDPVSGDLFVAETDGGIARWDLKTRERRATGIRIIGYQGRIRIGPKGHYMVTSSRPNRFLGFALPTLQLWDLRSGGLVHDFGAYSVGVRSFDLSSDGRTVVTAGDSDLRVWDVESGKPVAVLRGSSDGEWVSATPDGYFASSPEGTEGIYWVMRNGVESFPVELFDATLRRPGIIERRLAGERDFAVPAPKPTRPPHVSLLGAHEPDPDGQVELRVRARGATGLRSVRAFVNGRAAADHAVEGTDAIVSLSLSLGRGSNRIHLVAYDERGLPSNPVVLDLRSQEGAEAPRVHVVAIGVSEYARLPESLWLEVADDDARAIAGAFRATDFYADVSDVLLVNQNATRDAVLEAIRGLAATSPLDLSVVFLAGHGVQVNRRFYFLPHDAADMGSSEQGLDWEQLREALAAIPGRTLLLLDACHSSSLVEETIIPNDALARAFFDGGRRSIMVFSASKGRQKAGELGEHGRFTHFLLAGLGSAAREADRDGNGTVEFLEWIEFVRDGVSRDSLGAQTPWLSRRSWFGDFPIARVH